MKVHIYNKCSECSRDSVHALTRLIMDRRSRSEMPGTLKPVFVDWARERAVQTPDMEERVQDNVGRTASVSTRHLGGKVKHL
jgi:hypothetical protein